MLQKQSQNFNFPYLLQCIPLNVSSGNSVVHQVDNVLLTNFLILNTWMFDSVSIL